MLFPMLAKRKGLVTLLVGIAAIGSYAQSKSSGPRANHNANPFSTANSDPFEISVRATCGVVPNPQAFGGLYQLQFQRKTDRRTNLSTYLVVFVGIKNALGQPDTVVDLDFRGTTTRDGLIDYLMRPMLRSPITADIRLVGAPSNGASGEFNGKITLNGTTAPMICGGAGLEG